MKQRTEQQPDAATRPTQLPFFNRQTNAQAVIQTKLTVGSSNDAHEQEANKTADMVMRKPENSAQNGAYTEGSYFSPTITPMVQRACAHCDNEKEQTAQRKETGAATGGFAAPPSVANAISRSGSALDGNAKTFMESRFNRSFDNVQVHTDGESAASARDISARAYTSGNHIVFGEGQYQPNNDSGRHLLAHELTHVVQQGRGNTELNRSCSDGDCTTCAEGTKRITLDIFFRIRANEANMAQVNREVREVKAVLKKCCVDVNVNFHWQMLSGGNSFDPGTARPAGSADGAWDYTDDAETLGEGNTFSSATGVPVLIVDSVPRTGGGVTVSHPFDTQFTGAHYVVIGVNQVNGNVRSTIAHELGHYAGILSHASTTGIMGTSGDDVNGAYCSAVRNIADAPA